MPPARNRTMMEAMAAYEKAQVAFQSVITSASATEEQIAAAVRAQKAARVAFGDAVISDAGERVAALKKLASELRKVVAKFGEDCLGSLAKKVTSVLGAVVGALAAEEPEPGP
jgi:phage-related protein